MSARRGPGKDTRLYVQLALDFLDNPKTRPLSDKAKLTLLGLIIYSNRHKLDGRFDGATFRTFGTPAVRKELLTNHAERPSVVERDGWFLVHDFDKHNRTATEIEHLSVVRSKAAKAGKEGANSKQLAKQTRLESGGDSGKLLPRSSDLQITTSDTHSSQVPEREGYPQTGDKSDIGFTTTHPVDLGKVKTAVVRSCNRVPSDVQLFLIAQTIIDRTANPSVVESWTAWVISGVQNDWAEWQGLIDNPAVTS